MTLFYQTTTMDSYSQPSESVIETWKHASTKSNWRIVQLPNSFYQTEIKTPDGDWRDITRRSTIEEAETAIDNSISYYSKKLNFLDGPKVVKTF